MSDFLSDKPRDLTPAQLRFAHSEFKRFLNATGGIDKLRTPQEAEEMKKVLRKICLLARIKTK